MRGEIARVACAPPNRCRRRGSGWEDWRRVGSLGCWSVTCAPVQVRLRGDGRRVDLFNDDGGTFRGRRGHRPRQQEGWLPESREVQAGGVEGRCRVLSTSLTGAGGDAVSRDSSSASTMRLKLEAGLLCLLALLACFACGRLRAAPPSNPPDGEGSTREDNGRSREHMKHR